MNIDKLQILRDDLIEEHTSAIEVLNSIIHEAWAAAWPQGTEPEPEAPNLTPWMAIAEGELGVREISGRGHNARILEYHGTTNMGTWGSSRDETPWCSSFVNWCMEQAGFVGTDSAMARSWLKWGIGVDEPVPGCVVVLKRGTGNSGHVGFYRSNNPNFVKLLGGNQSDAVCEKGYNMSDVLGYRMPA